MEYWKDIIGYYGLYQISNKGRIKTLKNNTIRKTYTHRLGYILVSLNKNKTNKLFLVHRLVAKTFIENPNKFPEINHKNGIKSNNNIKNLEWVTRSQNEKHAFSSGLKLPRRGKDVQFTKFSDQKIIKILKDSKNKSRKQISKKYKISQSYLSQLINKRKRKFHLTLDKKNLY